MPKKRMSGFDHVESERLCTRKVLNEVEPQSKTGEDSSDLKRKSSPFSRSD